MVNRKKLSADELWTLLAQEGMIPTKEEYEKIQKEILLTCEEVDGLIKDDQVVFDVMVIFFHILSCDKCRTKYRKKREDQ